MTSNHFLFVILYFLSNFFLFIAEASASTDQELKSKFFNDQCQTGCSPEFKACYQKLTENDRNAIMNDLIGRRVLQKVQTVEGSGFYNFGSNTVPTATAKTEFNKAVGAKCQAIAMAEVKATQAQVAKSSGSSSSGKSGGSSSGDLLDAAKQMAPLALAVPGVKVAYDNVKDKAKKAVGDFKWGGAKTDKVEIGSAAKEAVADTNKNITTHNAENGTNIKPISEIGAGVASQPSSDPRPDFSAKKASTDASSPQATPNTALEKPATPSTPGSIQQQAANALNNQGVQTAAKKLEDTPAANEAAAAKNPASVDAPDAKAATDKAAADKLAQEAQTKLEGAIKQMYEGGGRCASEISKIEEAAKKYVILKQSCGTDAASADNFCDTMRNQKALDVQKMISAGTAVISKATAASESCGIMGNVSTLANGGMLAAQAVCSGYKFKCDFSCGDAKKEIALVAKLNGQPITSCVNTVIAEANSESNQGRAEMLKGFADKLVAAQNQVGQVVAEETPAVDPKITQCEKNGADILTMGAQAAALLSAAMDSKKCEEQLSSGSGGSGSGSLATTAQFCAQPGNSSSITCRCAADPNGAGCLGSLGGSDVSGFAGLQKGVGNVSGFASTGAPKVSDSDIQFGDIPSDVAVKKDNGLSPTSPFAAAAATGGGGGSGGGSGVAGSSKPGVAGAEEEKSKGFSMGFSSLAKGFGNLFGLKGNDKGGKSLSKEQKDIQLQAIKRKIASDQVRAEISTASGKSNFDKIKDRYAETRSSLISAP